VAIACAALVVAGGCGGGSGKASSPPVSDPRSSSELAADKAEAQRLLLRLPDLPADWTAEPDTAGAKAQRTATRERYAACVGESPLLVGGRDRAGAESDDFVDQNDQKASNAITVWPSRETARAELESSRQPKARGCYEAAVNGAIQEAVKNPPPDDPLPPGVTFGQVKVEVLNVPNLHADSVALRATLPISAQGQTADAIFDVVLAVKGRTTIDMTLQNLGEPFSPGLETTLINKVIDRAPAA